MPAGRGWFLDTKTGEAIEIEEHAAAVRDSPSRFRVRPENIEGKEREDILRLVIARGFIRVRWNNRGVVFEFDGNRAKALHLIREFLLAHEVSDYTPIRLHDLADDRFRSWGTWRDLSSGDGALALTTAQPRGYTQGGDGRAPRGERRMGDPGTRS